MFFNINRPVYVKLTDYGKTLWHTSNKEFNLPPPTPKKEDAEGWSEWQMWELMQVFGPHIFLGSDIPFETTIMIKSAHLDKDEPPRPTED